MQRELLVASVQNDSLKETISKMVISDLSGYGIEFVNGAVILNKQNQGDVAEFCRKQKEKLVDLESNLKQVWNSIPLYLAEDIGVSSPEGRRVLNQAIYCLYRKSVRHDVLKSMKISHYLEKAYSESFERWSDKTSEDLAYVCMKIDQIESSIRKTAFICAAVRYLDDEIKKFAQTNGTSVQGPYSNLDLPVAERWYLWSDVSDEVDGRRDSIRSSRRYQMGLEDSDPSSVKEGFYWRELRNEPYKFDMLYPDSPYPYRSLIWGNS